MSKFVAVCGQSGKFAEYIGKLFDQRILIYFPRLFAPDEGSMILGKVRSHLFNVTKLFRREILSAQAPDWVRTIYPFGFEAARPFGSGSMV